MTTMLLLPVLVPAVAGAHALLAVRARRAAAVLLVAGALASAAAVALAVAGADGGVVAVQGGLDVALELDPLARTFLVGLAAAGVIAAAGIARAIAAGRVAAAAAAALLLALGALQGAILAADTETLLLCWGGALAPVAALLACGGAGAARPALATLTRWAAADLALMTGFGLLAHAGGHGELARLHPGVSPIATVSFALVLAGAATRLGAHPLHGWMSDAAERAPAPAAFVIAAGKLASAYLLLRLQPAFAGPAAPALMAVLGVLSLGLGVLFAVAQASRPRRLAHLAAATSGAVLLALAWGPPALASALAVAFALAAALFSWSSPTAVIAPSLPSRAGLASALRRAERSLEPGLLARGAVDAAAVGGLAIDRLVNALYDRVATGLGRTASGLLRRAHTGRHSTYLAWSLFGVAAVVLYLVGGF